MNRFVLIGIPALLIQYGTFADTVVKGGSVHGVWKRSDTPHRLAADVVIRRGATLTIEGGVTVLAPPGCAITVVGILRAIGQPEQPILLTAADSAQGWHGIHFMNADDGSRLTRCTVSFGRALGPANRPPGAIPISDTTRLPDESGGGIFVSSSNPLLEYCVVTKNQALGRGGGLYCDGRRSPALRTSTITSNVSTLGGGGGIFAEECRLSIDSCIIEGNAALKWSGGGVYAVNSAISLTNSALRNNSAYGGGGVQFFLDRGSLMQGCSVTGNHARFGGGIECNERCRTIISRNTVSDNTADYGGGVALMEESPVQVSECLVAGNYARREGAGIFVADGGKPLIASTAITGNVSEGNGGGITCIDIEPTLSGLVIRENRALANGGGLHLSFANPILRAVNVSGNLARNGGGISMKNCPAVEFSGKDLCSVHRNMASEVGSDLFMLGGPLMRVPLDTFTVEMESDLHVYPSEKFLIDHRRTSLIQESANLYVSPTGDDASDGVSPTSPLRSLRMALIKILADSLHPRTIYLAEGEYEGRAFSGPFAARAVQHITLSGRGLADVRFGADRIIVSAPWWKQGWALLLYALALGTAIYGYWLYHLSRVKFAHQMEIDRIEAEQLREINRAKSQFFADISHEFRTPLTMIIGPADLALQESQEGLVRSRLEVIRRNADRLHSLINQVLEFSRLEAGTVRLAVSRSEMVAFLRRVVDSFQSWAERKQVTIAFVSQERLIEAYFDEEKLERILNNLLSNALRFTNDGGHVVVRISLVGGSVAIAVSDTGCGIGPEHVPHIFDRFYRVDESDKTGGAGIGLALVRELVDLHHGAITLESTPGKGSTFTVRIPIGKDAYPDEEIVSHPPEPGDEGPGGHQGDSPGVAEPASQDWQPGAKPIVLVVEDNADVRAFLRERLAGEYAVVEAEHGRAAIEQSRESVPDLVVSDVMMPEMDGYELTRELKTDERTCHIPVILLTARASAESKIEGLETGADDYLTKPFDPQELLVRIRNLLELRARLRKTFAKGVVLRPGEVSVASLDDAFLRRLMSIVEANMAKADFSVEELARQACLSRMQLYRKLLALTGLSPSEFTRRMRLQRARDLLGKNAGTVAEIAEMTGFESHSYFSRCFQEEFGILPGEVREHK